MNIDDMVRKTISGWWDQQVPPEEDTPSANVPDDNQQDPEQDAESTQDTGSPGSLGINSETADQQNKATDSVAELQQPVDDTQPVQALNTNIDQPESVPEMQPGMEESQPDASIDPTNITVDEADSLDQGDDNTQPDAMPEVPNNEADTPSPMETVEIVDPGVQPIGDLSHTADSGWDKDSHPGVVPDVQQPAPIGSIDATVEPPQEDEQITPQSPDPSDLEEIEPSLDSPQGQDAITPQSPDPSDLEEIEPQDEQAQPNDPMTPGSNEPDALPNLEPAIDGTQELETITPEISGPGEAEDLDTSAITTEELDSIAPKITGPENIGVVSQDTLDVQDVGEIAPSSPDPIGEDTPVDNSNDVQSSEVSGTAPSAESNQAEWSPTFEPPHPGEPQEALSSVQPDLPSEGLSGDNLLDSQDTAYPESSSDEFNAPPDSSVDTTEAVGRIDPSRTDSPSEMPAIPEPTWEPSGNELMHDAIRERDLPVSVDHTKIDQKNGSSPAINMNVTMGLNESVASQIAEQISPHLDRIQSVIQRHVEDVMSMRETQVALMGVE